MPDKIKIGWKEYKVKVVEPKQILKVDSEECYGEINFDEQLINLSALYTQEQQEATLIHEVLHGIEDMYNIELGEEKVKKLANALYTVLKDNELVIKGVG